MLYFLSRGLRRLSSNDIIPIRLVYSLGSEQLSQSPEKESLVELNSILQDSAEGTLRSSTGAVIALGRIVHKSPIQRKYLQEDVRFIRLKNFLKKSNYTQHPHLLLSAIYGFKLLEDKEAVGELELELKWLMRRCPVRFLSKFVEGYVGSGAELGSYPKDHPVHIAIETLGRRWVEVRSGNDFVTTFKIMAYLLPETREKLEDRAVELVQEFTLTQMIKMMISVSESKRRPTPLLRALAYHISKTNEKILAKDAIQLIYALNKLTFPDFVLLERLCTELRPEISSIQSISLISSLLTSLGQMRYAHKDLYTSMGEWLSEHLKEIRPSDGAAWLLASAAIGFDQTPFSALLKKVKSLLTEQTTETAGQWLAVGHALFVLGQSDTTLLKTLLRPQFIDKLSLSCSGDNWRLKVLQVNAVALNSRTLGLGHYDGPHLSSKKLEEWTKQLKPTNPPYSILLQETLNHFLPQPKYLQTAIKHTSGLVIDGICLVNEKADPLPLNWKGSKGDVRVGLVGLSYWEHTIGERKPTGSALLAIRLLEAEGFRIVAVPFGEFSSNDKLLRRVQYLEQRIRESRKLPSSPS